MPTSGAAATSRSSTGSVDGQLVARVGLEVAEHDPAHALDDAHEADARVVHVDVADQQMRARYEHPGGDGERGRAHVAGHGNLVQRELVGVDDREVAAVAPDGHAGVSSIRSVWSRLGAGSVMVVAPSAASAASIVHDFTCAEATGSS